MDDLIAYIHFIQEVEGLKCMTRTAWTSTGRRESTAEHSWRLALLAGLLLPAYPGLDARRVLMLCLAHDLGEVYEGDISAALRPDQEEKERQERAAVKRAAASLPEKAGLELCKLWEEYNACETPEARLVKALDKAETILQHNQGANPPEFDYAFNLEYGKKYFEYDPLLRNLRALLDEQTRERVLKQEQRC